MLMVSTLQLLSSCAGAPGPGTTPPPRDAPAPGACTSDGSALDDAFLYGDAIVDLALELDPSAIAGLATDAGQDVPDVPATFVYAGERYAVGLHLRGGQGSFQPFDQKPGFAIDFTFADPEARVFGLKPRWFAKKSITKMPKIC